MGSTARCRRWLLVALAASVLAACDGGSDAPEDASDDPAADAAAKDERAEDETATPEDRADEIDGATDGGTEPTPGADVGPDPADLTDPIATYVHPIPDGDGASLTVDVTSLDVVGELLRVGITFTPQEAEHLDVTLNQVLRDGGGGGGGVYPALIDPVNLLEYEQVGNALPNGTSFPLHDGEPRTFAFYFAAPEVEPDTLDIILAAQFPTLTDVPYGR